MKKKYIRKKRKKKEKRKKKRKREAIATRSNRKFHSLSKIILLMSSYIFNTNCKVERS
jgi:hypothetical protein